MNREEWVANGHRTNKYRRYVNNAFNKWKAENNITERCAVHHRDDTEETQKYNSEHYERWGFNDNGEFIEGQYVIFMTLSEHTTYHKTGERNSMYGKHRSEETRERISAAHKGKKLSDEHRAKISTAQKGKTHSEETCAKMSVALCGERNPMYGKHHSEETRAKMSANNSRKSIKILYSTYKNNGGILKWNDFQRALKNGEITFEVQSISVYTKEINK